jgi:hypothetical protein
LSWRCGISNVAIAPPVFHSALCTRSRAVVARRNCPLT